MDSEGFKSWLTLKNRGKKTIQNRISNARNVENFEGDLDKHYEKDFGISLMTKLYYSKKDEREGLPVKHDVPINGVFRTGSSTLKNAVKLYMDFRLFTTNNNIDKLESSILEINNNNKLSQEDKRVLIKYRLKQSFFRNLLIAHWDGRCSISGFERTELLLASHIKPYSECVDSEKYDVFNGLLLTPNYDKLFDKFLISFDDKGKLIIADSLSDYELDSLGISRNSIIKISTKHKIYLKFHRHKLEELYSERKNLNK